VNFDDEVESLVRTVQSVVFRTTRLGVGYDRQEVDAFRDDVIEKVRRGELVSPPRFSQTRMRPGYVMSDVDSLIAEVFRLGPPPVPQKAQAAVAQQPPAAVPQQAPPPPLPPSTRRLNAPRSGQPGAS
jgi:DivIVA domain-containing protein